VIVQSRWEEAAQAAALLAAGPEPLRSQFGVGFGTALNLLATRSLDEARAFVQRSFANYLGAPRPALPPPPPGGFCSCRPAAPLHQQLSVKIRGGILECSYDQLISIAQLN